MAVSAAYQRMAKNNPWARPAVPKLAGGVPLSSVAQKVRQGTKVAPEEPSVDYSGIWKALGVPDLFPPIDNTEPTATEPQYGTLPAPLSGPTRTQPETLKAMADRLRAQSDTSEQDAASRYDPFGQLKVQNQAAQVKTDAEKVAMDLTPPVRQSYLPFDPVAAGGKYPQMQTLPIPQRGEANPTPAASILAGIGSIIAPQAAGKFGAATIQGAVDRANTNYQDALHQRQLKLAELTQRHEDELNARNETIKYAEGNLRGKELVDFRNAVAENDWKRAGLMIGADKAGQVSTATGLDTLTKSEQDHNQAILGVNALRRSADQADQERSAILLGRQAIVKQQLQQADTIAKIREAQSRDRATDAYHQGMLKNTSERDFGRPADPTTGAPAIPGKNQIAQNSMLNRHADNQARIAASIANNTRTVNARLAAIGAGGGKGTDVYSMRGRALTQAANRRSIEYGQMAKNFQTANFGGPLKPDQQSALDAKAAESQAAAKALDDYTQNMVTNPPQKGGAAPKMKRAIGPNGQRGSLPANTDVSKYSGWKWE